MRERPFFNCSNQQLFEMWSAGEWDTEQLVDIAYELQFRKTADCEIKADIVEVLIDRVLEAEAFYDAVRKAAAEQGVAPEEPEPDFDFPKILPGATRRQHYRKMGIPDWQTEGLLKISGYSVGKKDGKPQHERRKILNYIFLVDDLADIEDVVYAAQWGEPKTADRLLKIANSLTAFAHNAMKSPNDTEVAVSQWSQDLDYLKRTFYEDWHGFPWPELTEEAERVY
ncbi:hypothetical protein [Microbulbifer agarilyticus]